MLSIKSVVKSLAGSAVWKSRFVSQVLAVGRGTGLAQAALICFSPVLSRLYAPEAFAVFAIFAVYAHLLSIVGSGRYEMALMLPEDDEEAIGALVLASGFPLVATALAYVGLVTCYLTGVSMPSWVWVVPVGALVFAWGNVSSRWQARKQRFSAIGHAEVIAVLISLGIQIGGGVFSDSIDGTYLIWGVIFGRIAAVIYLWQTVQIDWEKNKGELTRQRLVEIAKRYIRFPMLSATSSLIGKLNQDLPKLMLAALYGPHVLGCFAICSRVLGVPLTLIGKAIGDVFFPRVSETRYSSKATMELLFRVSITCFLIILGPALILFFWSEWLFSFVFGEQWAVAGVYARLLIPVFMVQFIVRPVALALHAFEKQNAVFLWQACSLVVLLGAFLYGYSFQSPETAILCYSLTFAVLLLIYLAMIFYFARGLKSNKSTGEEKNYAMS